MGIDVVHVLHRHARVFDGAAHHAHRAVPVLGRRCEVECVPAHAVADEFGDHRRVPPLRELQLFQHQQASPLADHEAVPVNVPRPGGPCGVVVARRKRLHVAEARDAHRRDGRLRPAADHRVRIALLDQAERVADRVGAARAGRRGGRIRPLGVPADRDLPGGEIDDRRRNEEGRDPARTGRQQLGMLALDDVEPSDPAPDIDAHPRSRCRRDLQARHAHRELARGQREENEPPHLPQILGGDEVERIEVPDFARDAAGEGGSVEMRNGADPVAALAQGGPALLGPDAHGRDEADAGDDNSSWQQEAC